MRTFTLFLFLGISSLLYSQDGTLDPGFGNNGIVETDFNGLDDYVVSIATQSDGKILAGGVVTLPSTDVTQVVVRYNTDGTIDNSFGNTGH